MRTIISYMQQVSTDGKCHVRSTDVLEVQTVADVICEILDGLQVSYTRRSLTTQIEVIELDITDNNRIVQQPLTGGDDR